MTEKQQRFKLFFGSLLHAMLMFGMWILAGRLITFLIPNRAIEMILILVSLPLICYIWIRFVILKNGRPN